MALDVNRHRVFISYSHSDKQSAEKIANILSRNMLLPVWDKNLRIGEFFDDQIRNYIAHSHVFLPLITAASSARGWVHQEIGYAMALNIPVLPVSVGQMPGEMIQRLQAVVLDETLSGAEEKLTYSVFDQLVKKYVPFQSPYHYTELNHERAEKITEMANYITQIGFSACVRQKGGCSSFQIPNKILSDTVWDERYYPKEKVETHCKYQLNERKALETHARKAGCKLIVNPNLILAERYHVISMKARLGTFLEFLESIPEDKVDVVFDDKLTFSETATIVGDWFSSESYFRSETQGFKHSIFTCHAPGIMNKIEAIDEEFDSLLRSNGIKMGSSRKAAIERINGLLKGLR